MADCCCSPLGPPAGGGGGFAPIQNTRYLDPTFVGTSTGSIGAPYADLTPFLAEVAGSERGWELWLPPDPDLAGGTVPDFGDGGGLVLRGLSPAMTYFGATWTIAAQTAGQPQMDFHDVGLTQLQALGGTVHFELVNCFVDSFDVSGLAGGSARFRNAQCIGCAWPTDGFTLEVFGGSLSGDCSWDEAALYNVEIGSGTYTPGASEQRLVGCTFAGGVTISNANAPTLIMDAFTYRTFVSSAVVFAGTVIVAGASPVTYLHWSLPGGATAGNFFSAFGGTSLGATTEANSSILVSAAGSVSNLRLSTPDGSTVGADQTATIRVNGINTTLDATVPNGSATGASGAILEAVAQFDRVSLIAATNAGPLIATLELRT